MLTPTNGRRHVEDATLEKARITPESPGAWLPGDNRRCTYPLLAFCPVPDDEEDAMHHGKKLRKLRGESAHRMSTLRCVSLRRTGAASDRA